MQPPNPPAPDPPPKKNIPSYPMPSWYYLKQIQTYKTWLNRNTRSAYQKRLGRANRARRLIGAQRDRVQRPEPNSKPPSRAKKIWHYVPYHGASLDLQHIAYMNAAWQSLRDKDKGIEHKVVMYDPNNLGQLSDVSPGDTVRVITHGSIDGVGITCGHKQFSPIQLAQQLSSPRRGNPPGEGLNVKDVGVELTWCYGAGDGGFPPNPQSALTWLQTSGKGGQPRSAYETARYLVELSGERPAYVDCYFGPATTHPGFAHRTAGISGKFNQYLLKGLPSTGLKKNETVWTTMAKNPAYQDKYNRLRMVFDPVKDESGQFTFAPSIDPNIFERNKAMQPYKSLKVKKGLTGKPKKIKNKPHKGAPPRDWHF